MASVDETVVVSNLFFWRLLMSVKLGLSSVLTEGSTCWALFLVLIFASTDMLSPSLDISCQTPPIGASAVDG